MSAEKPWIEWAGGTCPLPNDTYHEVRFRDGEEYTDEEPQGWDWEHSNCDEDIVAYRVL